jgi:hypothetical protein
MRLPLILDLIGLIELVEYLSKHRTTVRASARCWAPRPPAHPGDQAQLMITGAHG